MKATVKNEHEGEVTIKVVYADSGIDDPETAPGAVRVLKGMKRFNVCCCGRRFGKTALGEHRLLQPMLAGLPVAWFAPNYKYLWEVWRDFVRLLRPVTAGKPNKSECRIELITGGSIEFWTLVDPDSGRSRKYARVVIDEAAKVPRLEQAWQESIRPSLTDLKGQADFYSTPKGRNYFWQLFTRGQDPLQPEWASWQIPTSQNPYIAPAEIAAARTQLPQRVFEQEYLAAFQEENAGVFRGVHQAIDKGRRANDPAKAGTVYANGLDLARVEDFTVETSLDPRGRQAYFDRFQEISWERQLGSVHKWATTYKGSLHFDATGMGGDVIAEALRKRHVNATPFVFTNASKNEVIDHLALGIETGKLRLLDNDVQTNELLAFEYRMSPSRKVILSAPEGGHDDCVTALALAYWGAANPNRLRFM